MRDLARRVAVLEKLVPDPAPAINPEYLAAISDDDLEFVARIRIPDGAGENGPIYVSLESLTDDEHERLQDIVRRMNHGPDA